MARAFTLIELLVVVTIIVVLLALLMPALDRAIYQAELAACGGRLDGLGVSVTAYAVGNGRRYPNPPGGRITNGQVDLLGIEGQPQQDLRPLLVGSYVSFESFLDPLNGGIDLSYEANNDGVQVYSNYPTWFGLRFPGGAGMSRIGDRLTWTDTYTGQPNIFNVLVSDYNVVADPDTGSAVTGNVQTQAGHPDNDGTMFRFKTQNGNIWIALILGTISRWQGPLDRGPLDLNFALDDGSVLRIPQARATIKEEPRLRRTPIVPDDSDPNWRHHMPSTN